MKPDHRILILYHSGAGSTKTIAEIYHYLLTEKGCDITPIHPKFDYGLLENYNYLILGFPTYHGAPSDSIMDFIKTMPQFSSPKQAFIFTTCGLYAANTLRIFASECNLKNIHITDYSTYIAPASDGVLLFPKVNFMFNYEKQIAAHIRKDLRVITDSLTNSSKSCKIPRFKLYSILNYPNKYFGKKFKYNIRIEPQSCINCNKCIDNCIRGCWSIEERYPIFDPLNCEYCFKCIHHCPTNSIYLNSKTKTKPKLNDPFFNKKKTDILHQLNKIKLL